MNDVKKLIDNIDKLHTTELGLKRIKRNLSLDTDDVIKWCKQVICSSNSTFILNGKNWYIHNEKCIITVNAHSFTVITAHKK